MPRTGAHYAGKDVTAMTPEEYQALVKRMAPRSPILRDTALAFLVGGAICVVGQLLSHWYGTLGLDDSDAGTATSVTLVFLSALATGLGLYHKLARWAGAGTLVPITGFANAVASPAVDFQAEERVIITLSQKCRCFRRVC